MVVAELREHRAYYRRLVHGSDAELDRAVAEARGFNTLGAGTGAVARGALQKDAARYLGAVHVAALASVVRRPVTVFTAPAAHSQLDPSILFFTQARRRVQPA